MPDPLAGRRSHARLAPVHAAAGLVVGGRPDHRARRRHRPDRHRRQRATSTASRRSGATSTATGIPTIDAAVRAQLDRVAHSTMLGPHAPGRDRAGASGSSAIAPPGPAAASSTRTAARRPPRSRSRWRSSTGSSRAATRARKTRFVSLRHAYHGDTVGSVSVGGIDLFHAMYRPLLFDTLKVDPGDADELDFVLAGYDGRGRRGDHRAARPGRRRDDHAARRLPARRCASCATATARC